MPKVSTSRAAAAAERMDVEDAGAAGASAPSEEPMQDVAPMPLFPPITAADLLGGKIEWRKVCDACLACSGCRLRSAGTLTGVRLLYGATA